MDGPGPPLPWAFCGPDSTGHATGGTAPQLQLRHHLRDQLELGFDYLRDNMAADISEVVQRSSSTA